MKKWALLVAGLLLAGCGGKQATTGGKPTRTFAVIPKDLANPVFNTAKRGAEDAAKQLGDVRIEWTAPQTQDPAQQVAVVQNVVSAKVNGIAISCSDAAALTPAIDKAVAAGIPVVCWDADAPKSKRLAFYGVDDYKAGQKMAEIMKRLLPEGGDVAILSGAAGAENLNRRMKGFTDGLQGTKITALPPQYCNDDIARSVSIVRDFSRSHPTLKGWCFVGGWPLFGAAPGPFAGMKPGQLKIVSFDTLKPELEYVRQGYVDTLIGQKVYEWGHTSVMMLDGITKGKKYPAFVDSGMDIVDKTNLDQFVKTHPE